MPKYVYFCKECEDEFEVRHLLRESIEICQLCDMSGQLIRRPSTIFLNKKNSSLSTENKPGSIVKETIEETKSELRAEHQRLSKREYKNE
jgi:hypothetical protein